MSGCRRRASLRAQAAWVWRARPASAAQATRSAGFPAGETTHSASAKPCISTHSTSSLRNRVFASRLTTGWGNNEIFIRRVVSIRQSAVKAGPGQCASAHVPGASVVPTVDGCMDAWIVGWPAEDFPRATDWRIPGRRLARVPWPGGNFLCPVGRRAMWGCQLPHASCNLTRYGGRRRHHRNDFPSRPAEKLRPPHDNAGNAIN